MGYITLVENPSKEGVTTLAVIVKIILLQTDLVAEQET